MISRTKFTLLFVIALAVFFRFFDLAAIPPGLYPDEAMNGNNGREALINKDWKVFYTENNGREGLFINIQSGFIRFLGNEPWALRLPSAIFGTLSVLGLYFLTRELFKKRGLDASGAQDENSLFGIPESECIALAAAFFMAVSFWHVNFSRIGFRAILAPFFLIWSLWLFLRVSKDIGSRFSQILSAVLGGDLFGLGFHTYIAYRLAPFLLLPLMPFENLRKKEQSRTSCFPCLFLLFLFFALITVFPLGIYFFQHPEDFLGRTSQISIFSQPSPVSAFAVNLAKTFGMFWIWGDQNWRHNFAGAPQLWWPVGIFFFIGLVASLRAIRRNRVALFLLTWFFVMLLPALVSAEGIPHALRSIVVIPPVMILSGWGAVLIFRKISEWLSGQKEKYPEFARQLGRIKKELSLLFLLVLLAITAHTFNQYFLRWAGRPEVYFAFSANYAELGRYLNTLPDSLPKYIIVNVQGVEVRGIPMPSQSVMFLTDTFRESERTRKNFFYLLPDHIPYEELQRREEFLLAMLELDGKFRQQLKEQIPGLTTRAVGGTIALVKEKHE